MKRFILGITILLSACATPESKTGFYKGYETPDYKIIKKWDNVEIREYPPILVAEVTVQGDRKQAVGEGFKLLAGYIFGGNTGLQEQSQKIAMTSPVIQSRQLPDDKGATIAMTSPVMQAPAESGWVVQFPMPRQYSLDNLPAPKDKRIQLRMTPKKKLVALTYSGWWSESYFTAAKTKLESAIKEHKLKTKGDIGIMYYDDPFTLPSNRRNEVMVEIH